MLFDNTVEKFITGNEAAIQGAITAGANLMCGYPITPSTEILEGWAKLASGPKNKVKFLQTEDETSAGFGVIGGTLAGVKSFTATAGVGHVLMQDPISMAEAMRLPFVGIVMQRGGPSTGTVIYSQQEVTLACDGGNGEGLRVVYSPSNPQEIYDYTIKSFNTAWKYKFPTILLGDGYQSKMKSKVRFNKPGIVESKPILAGSDISVNIRNCYNFENQLRDVLLRNISDFQKMAPSVIESEEYKCSDADEVIFAHGIVAGAAKEAVDILRNIYKKRIGLFRPITLKPFPIDAASKIASRVGKILVVESSNGHFLRLVKNGLYGLSKIECMLKPVEGISAEEIVDKIRKRDESFWTEH